jgi:hypothetical protein
MQEDVIINGILIAGAWIFAEKVKEICSKMQ